ncbi:MAG TPA: hypothetical protein VF950_19430 [Planctomycetota bacterium]
MNALLLGLSLVFAGSQVVAWADCCCGSFCRHKNACTGCGPEDACPGGSEKRARKSSCCDEDASQPRKTCTHVEPSSEIDHVSADAHAAPPAPLDCVPDVETYARPVFLAPPLTPPDTGPPRAGPPRLFLSALRI